MTTWELYAAGPPAVESPAQEQRRDDSGILHEFRFKEVS
jgi:hypothetical protein